MAILLDSSTSNTTASFSYTCTGGNLCLVVAISWTSATASSASGVTYGGVALTQSLDGHQTNGSAQSEIWYLLGPPSGANTLTFTNTGSSTRVTMVTSYTGVDQTGIDTHNFINTATFNTATPASIPMTTSVANAWIVSGGAMGGASVGTEISAHTPAVTRFAITSGTGAAAMGDLATTTSGSNPFQWDRSLSTARSFVGLAIALKPAPVSFVSGQSVNGSGVATGTATSGAFPASTVTGNTIIVAASVNTNTANDVTSVTDNKSNTYTRATQKNGNSSEVEIWYCSNITGGASHTVTATSANSFRNVAVLAQEFNGLLTSAALDKVAGATGSSTAPSSGATATTAQANELVVGALIMESNTTMVVGTGFSNLVRDTTIASVQPGLESKVVIATGAQTATFTLGASELWDCAVATFKGPAGGGAAAFIAQPFKMPIQAPNRASTY